MDILKTTFELEIKVKPSTRGKEEVLRRLSTVGQRNLGRCLCELLGISAALVEWRSDLSQVDEYLDDDQFSLLASGSSCRIRTADAKRKVTLKAPSGTQVAGCLSREESSTPLSAIEYEELIVRGKLPLDAEKALPRAVGTLKPVLTIHNVRSVFQLELNNGVFALCLDCFSIVNPANGARAPDCCEFEIEAEDPVAIEGISPLYAAVTCTANETGLLELSRGSKYEYGMERLGLGTQSGQRVLSRP